MSRKDLQSRMETWLAGQYEAYLFESSDGVIGYVLFRRESQHVYVRQFFIRNEFRRRGYGRTAFERLLKDVWKGERRIRLDVLINNRNGIAFWRSLGFADYCITMERDRTG